MNNYHRMPDPNEKAPSPPPPPPRPAPIRHEIRYLPPPKESVDFQKMAECANREIMGSFGVPAHILRGVFVPIVAMDFDGPIYPLDRYVSAKALDAPPVEGSIDRLNQIVEIARRLKAGQLDLVLGDHLPVDFIVDCLRATTTSVDRAMKKGKLKPAARKELLGILQAGAAEKKLVDSPARKAVQPMSLRIRAPPRPR